MGPWWLCFTCAVVLLRYHLSFLINLKFVFHHIKYENVDRVHCCLPSKLASPVCFKLISCQLLDHSRVDHHSSLSVCVCLETKWVLPPGTSDAGFLVSAMDSVIFCLILLTFVFLNGVSEAQNKLDPDEYQALASIFSRWGVSSSISTISWNLTGDICSGGALRDFNTYDNPNFNPGVLCDCSYQNNSTCHITRLKAREFGLVGPVPGELQRFKYLDNLDLGKNYLSGPLPAFIGNFSALKYLSIGFNLLSGSFPKELGKLQNLISLGIDYNDFSGPLPPEIGNMSSLEQIYIDSLGLSGEIPSTFSQLQKLRFMYASDNNFTGKLPDFIGNFTNLKSLRLQGNSFQGQIPSSFANLTQLTDLRLCDLVDGSSSLSFISNMNSLSTLTLRNSRISDTIPLDIGKFTNLQYLDLSFNHLTGILPDSLFSLNSLKALFLGNNSLSGSLPKQKSPSLITVDLSYNELSGSLPSWASDDGLQMNLVSNRFIIDKSSQKGLTCLQRDAPCYRNSPIYYSFAINCGGDTTVASSDGTLYEMDNYNLSSASYFVTDNTRWAVSSVGMFLDASDPKYIYSGSFQLPNTTDFELYETARIAPSSLRYYGLGLENGNYTVRLLFAETDFPNNRTWMARGRRVFDIYIQGDLKTKDFDIRKQAGGLSFTPVKMEYRTSITDNFLEIHLFWAGKGTCCIPAPGYYGPRISAISVTPNFKPTVQNRPPTTSKTKKTVKIIVGVVVVFIVLVIGILIWRWKRLHVDRNEDLVGLSVKPYYFTYAVLRAATDDFNPSNKLGEGGFGSVFKGKLADGRLVAVKQLSESSLQGKDQLISEIATICSVQHRNLVSLYGCCLERKKNLIVYEYMENKSLDQALFGNNNLRLHLDWPKRFQICLGTARGLAYLHEESRLRIVHRDIKASNILLDLDLNPKISDFGLAKLYDEKKTHISTKVAGTIGYLAPEYAMRGHLTEKVDVFAFGVVALEILCGRRTTDSSMGEDKMYLLEWVWNLHQEKNDLQMMDPSLPSYDKEEAMRVIGVALLCTQTFSSLRPPMSRVVAMLLGDAEVGEVTSKPAYLADWQFDDSTDMSESQSKGLLQITGSSSSGQSLGF